MFVTCFDLEGFEMIPNCSLRQDFAFEGALTLVCSRVLYVDRFRLSSKQGHVLRIVPLWHTILMPSSTLDLHCNLRPGFSDAMHSTNICADEPVAKKGGLRES